MSMFKWDLVDPKPGVAVAPHERLGWGKTAGLGAQHVIAMFGATFVFPIIMGLDPNLAIMMSGVATICFLLIVKGKVPSYLGTSASFVGGATAIYAQSGGPTDVTGAILVSGVVLAIIGVIIHVLGADSVNRVLPPVVTGAVVMLIGFNLAGVATDTYLPADRWIGLLTMLVVILMAVGLRGFAGRIAIFLGLIFGYLFSWFADAVFGQITSVLPGATEATTHDRVDWSGVEAASWFGFPDKTADGLVGNQALAGNLDAVGWHLPSFSVTFALLAMPAVIALVAENIGHVKAVSGMTGVDLDPVVGRAVAADGVGTVITSTVGGSPTTTYAENIGVMAATRVYSTAAYYVAAVVAILLGLIPKFGAIVAATPGGVLAGITAGALRHDRAAGRQDLDREPGQLRQSGQPGADRCRTHHRHRLRHGRLLRGHRRLHARGHRARHDRDRRCLPPLPPGRAQGRRRNDDGRRRAPAPTRRTTRHRTRTTSTGTTASRLKPAPFSYRRPGTLQEALEALAGDSGAKVLAGGQSLVPLLSMRLAAPSMLVDINGVPDLDQIRVDDDGVRVGALARHADVLAHPDVGRVQPLVTLALAQVAHATIRNRGTTVGSLVHADAAAEMPVVLKLLGGSVEVASATGRRTIPADDLFAGPLESTLTHDEIAVEAFFPALEDGAGVAFDEIARRHGDYALCGVAALVRLDGEAVVGAKAGYLSVSDVPTVVDLTASLSSGA